MESETVAMVEDSEPIVPKKTRKRKSTSLVHEICSSEEKEARIGALRAELEALFKYYREAISERVDLEAAKQSSVNAVVATLMEERDVPLSKLVVEIYDGAKALVVCKGLNTAAVKQAVLSVGQRTSYGVPNADADVLEDQSESCLWCWETRDLKLMPESVRGLLHIRRTCRKRIHERVIAVSEMIAALQKSDGDESLKSDLLKASNKFAKTSTEARIRQLIDQLMQKNSASLAQKDAKKEEKLLIKQLERNKREAEKEKKRLERETVKEKLQTEKEQKRQQEEAEKDEKRRVKEESDMRKQLKKQQEEAVKDQRRREKEEAELKKRISIQKQASIMERFVKRSKASPFQPDQSSIEVITTTDASSKKSEKVPEAVTHTMDRALLSNEDMIAEDVRKLHLSSWRQLGHSIRSKRNHWGMRQKPKTELFRQLKLTASTRPNIVTIDDSDEENLVDEFGECASNDRSCQTNASCSLPDVKKLTRRKQLLQFDKSHRPAFYGVWQQTSQVVGARHPFTKDSELDYDVDSDEEWEEEEPGESLSDCDKDEEDENLHEGGSKPDDEDESEDGFFVPDGYLSENEGVQVDCTDSDATAEIKTSLGVESEEFSTLLRQQKYLNNLADRALKKNQPLIISNLMHEKASLLTAEDLVGTQKLEQMCLLALSMRVFPGNSLIEISLDSMDIDREVSPPRLEDSATPTSTVIPISDSDLRIIVSAIRSCSHGIHKLAECLQEKFPALSKSQLRNKVREISDFAENRWQVKKEVLEKLGMPTSPEKSSGRTKSIAAFFSKRCLPPVGKCINANEISPQLVLKTSSGMEGQQRYT